VCETGAQNIEYLLRENSRLKERVSCLEKELVEIKRMLMEVYYSPGMPGAKEAARAFDASARS
jgi:hypothetical protein